MGGIYGIVEEIDEEDDLVVEIAEGIQVRIAARRRQRRQAGRREDEEPGEADEASASRKRPNSRSTRSTRKTRVNDHDGAVRDEPAAIRPPHRAASLEAPVNRRSAVLVIGFIVAALVAVAAMAIPASPIHDEPTLGLDLQGGLENTLQAVPPKGRQLTEDDLNRSEIMRDRVDKLGTAEPDIRTQGDDQIVIQLPGVKDPKRAAEVIGKTAQLELFDLEADLVSPSIDASTRRPVANESVYSLLSGQQALIGKESDQWYLFDGKKKLVAGPVGTREAALRKFDGKVPKGYRLFGVPPKTAVISCAAGNSAPRPRAASSRRSAFGT